MKKTLYRLLSLLLTAAVCAGSATPAAFAAGSFQTNLTDLKNLNGNWSETADGVRLSGSGDNFALSQTESRSFVYSADVSFEENHGAASLVFFSGDLPANGSYCANIDKSANNARIFRFPNGVTLGEYKLTEAQQRQTRFNLRVQATGNDLCFFLDGVPIVSCSDPLISRAGARLGLLTFDTGVLYQNVFCSEPGTPAPDSLRVEGTTLSQAFDKTVYSYTAKSSYEQDTVTLHASADGAAIRVFRLNAGEATEIDGADGAYAVPVPVGESEILLTVTRGNASTAYRLSVRRSDDPAQRYTEPYRPQFHFTPRAHFINDPNGLVYDPSSNRYQLFCQYNPTGMQIGNQVWLHASSDDMMNWTEDDDLAITQDDGLGAIFSGSAVVDADNTSGLFTDNAPDESKLVAFFTNDLPGDTTYGVEKQSLAYSKDHGHTWIKPTLEKEGFTNPVIPNAGEKYGRDFRDPKVFRYDGKWMMVVAGGRARLFTSDDLIHWQEAADLGMDSECPDLYCLPVDGDPNEMKWVYTASGRWYVVGDLKRDAVVDGVQKYKFVPETDRLPCNGAPEVYATQTYYNDGSGQNRRIGISWLQDVDTHTQIPEKGWNGVYSLPLNNTLRTVGGEPRLFSYPVEEVNAYRNGVLFSAEQLSVSKDSRNILAGVADDKFDLEAIITPNGATEFGFGLRTGGGQRTVVKYDLNKRQMTLDRSNSGKVRTDVNSMALEPLENGKIKLRILADTSVLEAFGNDGESAFSALIFPDPDSVGMSFFTDGDLTIDSLTIYDMNASVRTEIEREAMSVSATASVLSVGEQVEAWANVLPKTAQKPAWRVDGDCVTLTETENGTALLRGVKEGSAVVTATVGDKSASLRLTVANLEFRTNLTGWNAASGEWQVGYNGYTTTGVSGGDAFAVSDCKLNVFTYSASYFPGEGVSCGGLVFGVQNPAHPGGGSWFGANVTINGGTVTTKLFENRSGTEVWRLEQTIAGRDVYALQLSVDANRKIVYKVNGRTVAQKTLTTAIEGALGLVTYSSAGAFNDVFVRNDALDLSAASDAIQAAESLDLSGCTPESAKAVTDALAALQALLADGNVTQAQVDAAKAALDAAVANRKPKPSTPDTPSTPATPQKPAPQKPASQAPKNGVATVGGKPVLYKNGKPVTGTTLATVGGVTYAVKKGVVQKASKKAKYKLVKLGKKAYIVGVTGAVQKSGSAKTGKLLKVGKKRYIVNKKGVVQTAKKKYTLVKAGKRKYIVNKSGIVQTGKKKLKIGKAIYKTGKTGIAKKRK